MQAKVNLSVSPFSYRKSFQSRPLKLGDSFTQETYQTKFLGLVLDKNLTFKYHISYIESKVSRSVGVLFKLNSYLPIRILKMLYNSLILPHLNYGVECWYAAPNFSLNKLQVLQKKAVRAIFNMPYNSHTNDVFKENGLLKLVDIYRLNLACHMYNIRKMPANYDISLRPRSMSSIHSYETRNSIAIPRYNKTTSQSSFLYQSAKEWNLIPECIKNSRSLASFKGNLRRFYCDQYQMQQTSHNLEA